MITVIGLGCEPSDLPQGAAEVLRSGVKVILRTGETPAAEGVRALGVCFETLDYIYEASRNFDTLNKKLAAAVLSAAKEGDVAYCVDGSVTEDVSARLVLRRAKGAKVFCGASKADRAFAAAKVFSRSRTVRSAYALEGERPLLPLAVYDVDCDLIAGDVKLKLCDWFGDEADAFFVEGARQRK